MTIIEAAKLGAKWMEWWLRNTECDCMDVHECGKTERKRELEEIKKVIKEAQDGPCTEKRESRPEKSQSYPGQAVCEKCKQCWCVCA